jgi:hypothetical protein
MCSTVLCQWGRGITNRERRGSDRLGAQCGPMGLAIRERPNEHTDQEFVAGLVRAYVMQHPLQPNDVVLGNVCSFSVARSLLRSFRPELSWPSVMIEGLLATWIGPRRFSGRRSDTGIDDPTCLRVTLCSSMAASTQPPHFALGTLSLPDWVIPA